MRIGRTSLGPSRSVAAIRPALLDYRIKRILRLDFLTITTLHCGNYHLSVSTYWYSVCITLSLCSTQGITLDCYDRLEKLKANVCAVGGGSEGVSRGQAACPSSRDDMDASIGLLEASK